MSTIINNYFEFDSKVALVNRVYGKAAEFVDCLKKDEVVADVIKEVKNEPVVAGMVALTGIFMVGALYLLSLIQGC